MSVYFNSKEIKNNIDDINEHQFIFLIYRQWWHTLYDNAPELLNSFNDDGKNFLNKSLSYLYSIKKINLGYHLSILDYLKVNFSHLYTEKIISELIYSFCSHWVRLDNSCNKSVCVYSKILNLFYVGEKSNRLGIVPTVEFYENLDFNIEEDLLIVENRMSFSEIEDYKKMISNFAPYYELF